VIEYVEVLGGLDDSFEFWGGAADGRYLVSYEAGDDHFDWSEGYVGRLQYLIGLQSVRLPPAPGTGILASDPQGIEADGCSGSGCTDGFRSTPYADPTVANLTLVGMGALETAASGGVGAVLRRGTKGLIHNSIIANWKGTGISVRDSVTGNILASADSLNLTDMVFAENVADYDPAGTNYGQATEFTSDGHRSTANTATIITDHMPPGLDWTPLDIAASGCGTIPIPADRGMNFFGGTMDDTDYCGAVDPAGPLWYAGWTIHTTS
jgi:hypothetical protein